MLWLFSGPPGFTCWISFAPVIFYLPFQGDTSFVDHLFFCVLCFSCFCFCLLLPCGHLLGWLLLVMLIVVLLLSYVVSWVMCGT